MACEDLKLRVLRSGGFLGLGLRVVRFRSLGFRGLGLGSPCFSVAGVRVSGFTVSGFRILVFRNPRGRRQVQGLGLKFRI